MGSMKQRKKSFYKTINTNDIKSHYGKLFLELRSLIHRHDPIDIAKYGMEDEYDPETASILVQLNNNLSQVQVHELVYQDFMYWFNPVAGKKEKYKDLSSAIYKWLKQVDLNKKVQNNFK
jgi:hypothetical protein